MLYAIIGNGSGNHVEVKETLKSLLDTYRSEDGESDAYFSLVPVDNVDAREVVTKFLVDTLPYYITFGGSGDEVDNAAEAREGGLAEQVDHAMQEKDEGYPVEVLVADADSLTDEEFDAVETLIRHGISASDLCNQMLPLTIDEVAELDEAPLVAADDPIEYSESDLADLAVGELRSLIDADPRAYEGDRRKKEEMIAFLLSSPTPLVDMIEELEVAAADPELERILAEEAEIERKVRAAEEERPTATSGVLNTVSEVAVAPESPSGQLMVSLFVQPDGSVTAGVGEPNAGELARLDAFLRGMPNYDGNPVDFAIHLIRVGYGL